MTESCQMRIPTEKMGQFHQLLCNTRGHYMSIPFIMNGEFVVHFEYGDRKSFDSTWNRIVNPVDYTTQWRGIFSKIRAWL